MSGAYTRTLGAPQQGRDSTFPRFHLHPVEDPIATAAAGRPIFVQHERVQIIQPGNPNSPVLAVTDAERQRWPEQYAAFRKGEEVSVHGTPLEQWAYLPRNAVLELKAIDLHTVEQLAGLPDSALHKIGMAGRNIRDMAKAYMDDGAAQAITSEALARAERAEAQLAGLQKQVDEMRPMLERMHKEMMAVKNAPSAIDSYVPGDHDPMQAHNLPQAVLHEVAAPSALDGLAAPRRGPGRPAKQAA